MGFFSAGKWTGAEAESIRNEERSPDLGSLITGQREQVRIMLNDKPQIAELFIGQGFRDQILNAENKENAAKAIARTEPHFIPADVTELGSHYEAAYLIALAQILNSDEYNQ